MKSQTSLIGAAGEHYVMSHLLRRGLIAALAPPGAPNTDILVSNVVSDRLCSVQVKSRTNAGSDGGWAMSAKHENLISDSLYYCFVDFGNGKQHPDTYILPSKVVADVVKKDHAAWLAEPKRSGDARKDSSMRRLKPDHSKNLGSSSEYSLGWLEPYRENWEFLDVF